LVAGSDTPLGGAIVTLSGSGLTRSVSQISDVDGRFSFEHLPAGRYTVSAAKSPYLSMNYGATRPEGPGLTLALSPGTTSPPLVFRLPIGGVITGTIRDDTGTPLTGLSVIALLLQRGDAETRQANAATTDDRGIYRIFGLRPGNYLVAVTPHRTATGVARTSLAENDRRFAELSGPGGGRPIPSGEMTAQVSLTATFFPNTTSPIDASVIQVSSGEERAADVIVPVVFAGTVTGHVTSADGVALQSVSAVLDRMGPTLPLSVGRASIGPQRVAQDGTFRFVGVPPGRYLLSARGSASRGAEEQTFWAATEIVAGGGDLPGIQLQLAAPSTIAAKITIDAEGATKPDLSRLQLSLQPVVSQTIAASSAGSLRPTSASTATPDRDGTVLFRNVLPGKYRLVVPGSTAWWLRAVIIGGRDVADTGIDVSSTARLDAVVQLSTTSAELTGQVLTTTGTPASDYAIVLFPTDRSHWGAESRQTRQVRPDSEGRFSIDRLPAGTYHLAAIADVNSAEVLEPKLLEELSTASLTIPLAHGEKRKQDIRVGR